MSLSDLEMTMDDHAAGGAGNACGLPQAKSREEKIPLTQEGIDRLSKEETLKNGARIVAWKLALDSDGFGGVGLFPTHRILLAFLKKNGWSRPVHFSPTVPREDRLSLEPFLRLRGLVYDLAPVSKRDSMLRVDVERTAGFFRLDSIESGSLGLRFAAVRDSIAFRDPDVARFVIPHYEKAILELAHAMMQRGSRESDRRLIALREVTKEAFGNDELLQRDAVVARNLQRIDAYPKVKEIRQGTMPGKTGSL